MPNAKTRQKLADRFKPSIFSRIKQSLQARKKNLRMEEKEQEARDTKQELQGYNTFPSTQNAPTGDVLVYDMAATSTESTTIIWNTWMQQPPSTASAATTQVVWRVWSSDSPTIGTSLTTSRLSGNGFVGANMPPRRAVHPRVEVVETAEERRYREGLELRRQFEMAQILARQREAREAEAKSLDLLESLLTREQKTMLREYGYFLVEAKSGRLYKINRGTHGNVKVIDRLTRVTLESLCIQPNDVPVGDSMLMQKIMIETAEEVFRRHANISLPSGETIYGDPNPLTHESVHGPLLQTGIA